METAWKEKLLACTQACVEWIDSIETEIPGKGFLAGFHPPVWGKDFVWKILESDNAHYPMGNAVLYHGIGAVLKQAGKRRAGDSRETVLYKQSICRVYSALQEMILRHGRKAAMLAGRETKPEEKKRLETIAGICERISSGKPAVSPRDFSFSGFSIWPGIRWGQGASDGWIRRCILFTVCSSAPEPGTGRKRKKKSGSFMKSSTGWEREIPCET